MRYPWAFGLLLAGCSGDAEPSLAERGRALFESTKLSSAPNNPFSCATCHAATPSSNFDRLMPGAPLAGVTERPSYWGGQENDLLDAVNACFEQFMQASGPLRASEQRAAELYAFLESLRPSDPEPQAFTVVTALGDLPRGDAARGFQVWDRACAACHGEIVTGAGRLPGLPILPDDGIYSHQGYDAWSLRLVFIEKVRHGSFLGYPGLMPPFSREVLPDDMLSDLLEALGLTGEP